MSDTSQDRSKPDSFAVFSGKSQAFFGHKTGQSGAAASKMKPKANEVKGGTIQQIDVYKTK